MGDEDDGDAVGPGQGEDVVEDRGLGLRVEGLSEAATLGPRLSRSRRSAPRGPTLGRARVVFLLSFGKGDLAARQSRTSRRRPEAAS